VRRAPSGEGGRAAWQPRIDAGQQYE